MILAWHFVRFAGTSVERDGPAAWASISWRKNTLHAPGGLTRVTHHVQGWGRIARKKIHQRRDPPQVSRAEREAPDQGAPRIVTCAYCNDRLGSERVAFLAPPFADFVHPACLDAARARAAQVRRDPRRLRLVSGEGATGVPMNRSYTLRVLAIVMLASDVISAGCRAALAEANTSAVAAAALPGSFVLVQAHPVPDVPKAPVPTSNQPIGLPRVRDYEPIPELLDIYFDYGMAKIHPGDMKILEANAAWLRAHPAYLVLIEGHCDNRGATDKKNELNMDLGERRAQAAMSRLIAQGVHPSRITVLSYGEERPQCTEESEQCWSQNRRSRFLVKPR